MSVSEETCVQSSFGSKFNTKVSHVHRFDHVRLAGPQHTPNPDSSASTSANPGREAAGVVEYTQVQGGV